MEYVNSKIRGSDFHLFFIMQVNNWKLNKKEQSKGQDISSTTLGFPINRFVNYCPNRRWQAKISSRMRPLQLPVKSPGLSHINFTNDFRKIFWQLLLIQLYDIPTEFLSKGISRIDLYYSPPFSLLSLKRISSWFTI